MKTTRRMLCSIKTTSPDVRNAWWWWWWWWFINSLSLIENRRMKRNEEKEKMKSENTTLRC